jgi:hypothetical protein
VCRNKSRSKSTSVRICLAQVPMNNEKDLELTIHEPKPPNPFKIQSTPQKYSAYLQLITGERHFRTGIAMEKSQTLLIFFFIVHWIFCNRFSPSTYLFLILKIHSSSLKILSVHVRRFRIRLTGSDRIWNMMKKSRYRSRKSTKIMCKFRLNFNSIIYRSRIFSDHVEF